MENTNRRRGDNIGWQMGKTLADCNAYMFENQIGADVTFELTNEIEFNPLNLYSPIPRYLTCDEIHKSNYMSITAHKYVLISRSPVFEAMFCGEILQNSNCNELPVVKVPDANPIAFKEVLRYMYCDRANITADNVSSILYIAKKYLLQPLTSLCKAFLEKQLCLANVCSVLDQSIYYDEEELTLKCLRFIGPRIELIFQHESFLTLSQLALSKIVSYDYLYLESEGLLYKECLKWARHNYLNQNMTSNCDSTFNDLSTEGDDKALRSILGPVLKHIRFPNMQAIDFAKEVANQAVITDPEKCMIYKYILTGPPNSNDNDLQMSFDSAPRVQMCARFGAVGSAQQWWSCNGPTDAIVFKIDTSVELVGIALYGGKEPKSVHKAIIDVRELGSGTGEEAIRIAYLDHTLESDGCVQPWPIYFNNPTPIILTSGVRYVIMLNMKGPLTHYGTQGREKIVCNSRGMTRREDCDASNVSSLNASELDGAPSTDNRINFLFSNSTKSTNGSNVKSGQIPQIIFKVLE